MALSDLQAFVQECLNNVDPTIDTTPGSPYDVNVVQPILGRLGTDPFTVDIGLFIQTTLNQQFPDMPTKEGDAITDLLIKAAIVLWNPIVREITRVANAQSVRDPSILTTDEADALGANFFATRDVGKLTGGIVRIYFAQPQDCSVTPVNFVTTKEGLHFYPTQVQSIRVDEMLLNLEGVLYFFDINVVAEAAGAAYNIGPDDVVTIANLASATRITNKTRFTAGTNSETAVDFIDGIAQNLTERSLTTQAGIVAKVTTDFAAVTRLNVVGFNDPPMQRDIITGGGLGPILAAGLLMVAEADTESKVLTRRVTTAESVDFTALIGPTGEAVSGYTLTLVNAFPAGSLPVIRDLDVLTVVDAQTLDLSEQVLSYTATNIAWMLRKDTLTLSGIPGGILYPNTPDGTLTVPSNQIHIGGATDVFVRGAAYDSGTLTITDIVDDQPLLSGVDSTPDSATLLNLLDLVLAPGAGGNYSQGDATYEALASAPENNLSIELLDPPNAGTYRILSVLQTAGASPVLTVTPALTTGPFTSRWRISSSIFIDLVTPKETKIAGADLRTVQGIAVVDTISGVDFDDYGVGPNDILQITSGNLIVGEYVVQSVLAPLFTQVRVDRPLPASVNGATYSIYRPNVAGGVTRPFLRIESIALLDTSGQPVGTTIPYANPIDVQSQGFANSAHGIKADIADAVLGIVSQSLPGGVDVAGLTLVIKWDALTSAFPVTFSGSNPVPLTSVATQINAAAGLHTGATQATIEGVVNMTVITPSSLNGLTLTFAFEDEPPLYVTFSGVATLADVLAQINSVVSSVGTADIDSVGNYLRIRTIAVGSSAVLSVGAGSGNGTVGFTPATVHGTDGSITRLAVVLDNGNRLGLLPVSPNVTVQTGSTALFELFGVNTSETLTSRDITSASIDSVGGWVTLRPTLDTVFDVAQVLNGLQIGFYDGITIPNAPYAGGGTWDPLRTNHDFSPEVDRHIQVGARSLGTARLYFLDPTSFQVDSSSVFTYTNPTTGAVLTYFPDPTNNYQRIPALPTGTKPLDGETGGALSAYTFQSLSTDFIQEGIRPGDLLTIDFVPLAGTVALADPVANLNAKVLTVSLGGGINKNIIFIRDSGAIPSTSVSRAGVVTQVNNAVGQVICSLDVGNHLVFNPTASLIVVAATGGSSANALLGFNTTPGDDQNNDSPDKFTYTIEQVGPSGNPNRLVVRQPFPSGTTDTTRQQFSVYRAGVQRIVSTTMATHVESASLYYFDVELLSIGTGDQYNIGSMEQMTVTGFQSDGYYLTTDDPNLTFSPVERPKLHLSPSILQVGVTDAPSNATNLPGQNIQLNYDYSSLAGNVDSYIRSDTERVVNQSPLGRHLIPYFVRYSMTYSGGSAPSLVIADSQTYIQGLYPTDALSASNLQKLANSRGATKVSSPLNLVAVIHNFDRSVTVERSQDALNTGTLAAFFPDVLDITQNLTS